MRPLGGAHVTATPAEPAQTVHRSVRHFGGVGVRPVALRGRVVPVAGPVPGAASSTVCAGERQRGGGAMASESDAAPSVVVAEIKHCVARARVSHDWTAWGGARARGVLGSIVVFCGAHFACGGCCAREHLVVSSCSEWRRDDGVV